MKAQEQTIESFSAMQEWEFLNIFRYRVRDEWVIIDKGGLAEEYPVGTKEHGRPCEIARFIREV